MCIAESERLYRSDCVCVCVCGGGVFVGGIPLTNGTLSIPDVEDHRTIGENSLSVIDPGTFEHYTEPASSVSGN
jgi:hypothetical protein